MAKLNYYGKEYAIKEHSLFCNQKEKHLHRSNTMNKRHFYENNVAILLDSNMFY
jgi:hypothetical protein